MQKLNLTLKEMDEICEDRTETLEEMVFQVVVEYIRRHGIDN
jgi:hypothetical protein